MNIVVLGCGRVGAGVAHNLVLRRHTVTVVDRDPSAFDRLGPDFSGTRLQGSALDRHTLVLAGIERADAVAVVTGRDEVNAVVARAARVVLHVPVVVAALQDPRHAEIHQRLGIRTLAPVTWGIHRIADLLTASQLELELTLGAGDVEIVQLRLPSLLVGRPARELEVAGEITVVALTRGGHTVLATPATTLESGDLVHVAVRGSSLGRLEALVDQA